MTRRAAIKGLVGVAASATVGLSLADAETRKPTIERVEVRLIRLPLELTGFSIVQLSDFHFGPHFGDRDVLDVVTHTNSLRPDLVVLTGDFVTNTFYEDSVVSARQVEPCAELLSHIDAKFGVIAVLGNHDYQTEPRIVHHALKAAGIRVLYNEAVAIENRGRRLWIGGVGDVLNYHARLDETLSRVPQGETTILLVHEPDFADQAAKYPIDLQLSGHSHGGQVRLPAIGPVVLPSMGKKYPEGLRTIGRMQLYTNRGLGTIVVPVRVNCPPEITYLTLQPKLT